MPIPVAAPGLDVSGPLTDTLRSIMLFLPKLAMFVGIVAVGWIEQRGLAMTLTGAGGGHAAAPVYGSHPVTSNRATSGRAARARARSVPQRLVRLPDPR